MASVKKYGDPEDVVNINQEATDAMMAQLQEILSSGDLSNLSGNTGKINEIVSALMQPYSDTAIAQAQAQSRANLLGVRGSRANQGSLFSGASEAAQAQGSLAPLLAAQTQIAGLGTGISQQLIGGEQQKGIAALQGLTGLSQQEWWQPTYMETEDAYDKFMDFLNLGVNAVGTATGLGLFG